MDKIFIAGAGGIGRAAALLILDAQGWDCEVIIGDVSADQLAEANEWIQLGIGKKARLGTFLMPADGNADNFASVLSDARIIDVCSTGIVDQHLVIPRFIIKELYAQTETGDDTTKSKARRCLEVIKKMEQLGTLGLRFNDTDFPEVKDTTSKFIRLARLIDANILTADISRVQMASIEGVQIINLHSLSNALKPLMETGEMIKIKVQRYGKEPRQGVGYLDDGTMVVINGGGNFIGDVIDAQVLSVKHTSSGRMIFCNALEEGLEEQHKSVREKQETYYEEDYEEEGEDKE